MLRSQNRNKKIQLAAAATGLKREQMLECLVLSSIIIKPLSCCARWCSSAWARSRFWIANSKNASDKCFSINVYKNSRRLWWDRICKIMRIYSNNKCMCVFLISPVPIAEPLTAELIDTPVFNNLARDWLNTGFRYPSLILCVVKKCCKAEISLFSEISRLSYLDIQIVV